VRNEQGLYGFLEEKRHVKYVMDEIDTSLYQRKDLVPWEYFGGREFLPESSRYRFMGKLIKQLRK
jgi:hypothetical protein